MENPVRREEYQKEEMQRYWQNSIIRCIRKDYPMLEKEPPERNRQNNPWKSNNRREALAKMRKLSNTWGIGGVLRNIFLQ